jgi:hypothetical protein
MTDHWSEEQPDDPQYGNETRVIEKIAGIDCELSPMTLKKG